MLFRRLHCHPLSFTTPVSRHSPRVASVRRVSTSSAATADDVADDSSGLKKKVVTSVLACAGAALADPLMSIVDTAFVGHLGVLQLAALGPNGALFNAVFFLGFSALGVVASNQISTAYGARDHRAAGSSLILSSTVAFLLGMLITVVLIAAPCSVLQLFQTNAEMMPHAKTYCVIRALGVSSALLMVVFQAAFRAVQDMRTPLLVVAGSGLLNAVLDPILIYCLGMGIAGAAWATAASQMVGAAVFAVIIFQQRHLFGLSHAWDSVQQSVLSQAWSAAQAHAHHSPTIQNNTFTPNPSEGPEFSSIIAYPDSTAPTPRSVSPVARAAVAGSTATSAYAPVDMYEPGWWKTACALFPELPWKEFITTTLKLAVRCILILSTWTFASIAATKVGTYTMAAYLIMQQVLQLHLSVCWAFLAVGQSFVGVAIARAPGAVRHGGTTHDAVPASIHYDDIADKNMKRWSVSQREARIVGSRVVSLAAVASIGMAVLTFVLRDAVPKLFTTDTSVLKLVEGSMLMMCLMLAISWNNAIEGVLLGAGDTQFVMDIYPVCVFAFIVALSTSVAAGWGLVGIWGALVVYYVGLTCTVSARYWMRRFRCKI